MKMTKKRAAEVEAEMIAVADAKRKEDFEKAQAIVIEAVARVRRCHDDRQTAEGLLDKARAAYKLALYNYSTINCGIPATDLRDSE